MECKTCNGTGQVPDNIEERKRKFKSEIEKANLTLFLSKKMLNEFWRYWTESGGKKMRFEKEKTFEVKRRLMTWKNNDEKFNPKPTEEKIVMQGNYLDNVKNGRLR